MTDDEMKDLALELLALRRKLTSAHVTHVQDRLLDIAERLAGSVDSPPAPITYTRG